MTADELRQHFNLTFGLQAWPETYEVDAETYGNVCQSVFNWLIDEGPNPIYNYFESKPPHFKVGVSLGKKANGIMFKNVELILKNEIPITSTQGTIPHVVITKA